MLASCDRQSGQIALLIVASLSAQFECNIFVCRHQRLSQGALPEISSAYPHLPNVRTATREKGDDFQGWAFHPDGGTRIADG